MIIIYTIFFAYNSSFLFSYCLILQLTYIYFTLLVFLPNINMGGCLNYSDYIDIETVMKSKFVLQR